MLKTGGRRQKESKVYAGAGQGFGRLETTSGRSPAVLIDRTLVYQIPTAVQRAYLSLQKGSSYSLSEFKIRKILSGSGTERSQLSGNELLKSLMRGGDSACWPGPPQDYRLEHFQIPRESRNQKQMRVLT